MSVERFLAGWMAFVKTKKLALPIVKGSLAFRVGTR
jgi:hypothetical protein